MTWLAYMDYMDLTVRCPRKVIIKLNHSLIYNIWHDHFLQNTNKRHSLKLAYEDEV